MVLKHYFLLAMAQAAFVLPLSAQVSTGGQPYGLRAGLALDGIPTVRTAAFDAGAVAAEDAQREAMGKVPAYARVLPLQAGLDNAGLWTELLNGDRLWRLRVASDGALATELYFNDLHLPVNASLYVYSTDGRFVLGGFSEQNNRDDGSFATSLVPGDACILEYYEPFGVAGLGRISVGRVGHAYRNVGGMADASDPCEVDVNCSEGAGWQQQRDATVRIGIVDQGISYWCSGSLVNNLAQNCKPYFLTADHCGETTSPSDFALWKFYFNYQRANCGSGTFSSTHTMVGCTKRGSSNDNGGASGSDFLLLEASNPNVPASYNPYWAGWDATGTGSTAGVCIHHPAGDLKKISTFSGGTASSTWSNTPGTHWRVTWSTTAHGRGVTEGGSSGSPLFNSAHRIIGTLTGGLSCCTTAGCGPGTSPDGSDWYGKVSYHWQSNPGPVNQRLKQFLDPQNTGALTMDGSYAPCNEPAAVADTPVRAAALRVQPNPAQGATSVVLPEGHGRTRLLEVRDLGGRLAGSIAIGAEPQVELDARQFAEGTYVLRLLADGMVVAATPLIVVHP